MRQITSSRFCYEFDFSYLQAKNDVLDFNGEKYPSHLGQSDVNRIKRWGTLMCVKGKKKAKEEPGNYRCERCGGVSKDKKDLCKPKKIKGDKDKSGSDKKKKKKK